MEETELKLECELLKRGNKYLIFGLLSLYILLFLGSRFLTPTYLKNKLVYEGWLKEYHFEEYMIHAYILQIILFLGIGYAFYKILTLTIRINGVVIISEITIEVIRWKKFKFHFKINEIKDLKVHFNYFKKNDVEPRNLVNGNNNIIEFRRYNKNFKFEFLLQTEEEDEIFRRIMDIWESKNIKFDYKTGLAEF